MSHTFNENPSKLLSCHLPQTTMCYFILFLKNIFHLSCSKEEPKKIENPRKKLKTRRRRRSKRVFPKNEKEKIFLFLGCGNCRRWGWRRDMCWLDLWHVFFFWMLELGSPTIDSLACGRYYSYLEWHDLQVCYFCNWKWLVGLVNLIVQRKHLKLW